MGGVRVEGCLRGAMCERKSMGGVRVDGRVCRSVSRVVPQMDSLNLVSGPRSNTFRTWH
jgi:hypothetical protein